MSKGRRGLKYMTLRRIIIVYTECSIVIYSYSRYLHPSN